MKRSNLDAMIDRLALALARAHGYRPPRRRARRAAVQPPPHWYPQFPSEMEWRRWCQRDEESEAAEMTADELGRAG